MTGRIWCKCPEVPYLRYQANSHFLISIRAKIRDGVDGYSASNSYWLRCLYDGEKGDPEDVEKGFLKSTLLVKVRIPSTLCARP